MKTVAVVRTWHAVQHNRLDLLRATVESLRGQPGLDELVVLDNGSTDGTADVVREQYDGIAYRPPDGVHTAGRGMIVAMEEAIRRGADVVVFSDDDIRWHDDAVTKLRAFWGAAPSRVAILQGYLECEWSWNVCRGVVEAGGVKAIVRDSVPGGSWTFHRSRWESIRRHMTDGMGCDINCCTKLRAAGQQLAAAQLAENIGHGRSTWSDCGLGPPVDLIYWGLRAAGPAELERRFQQAKTAKSDISEHVATLAWYASHADHVTELGVRTAVSTTALLRGQPAVMKSYDIVDCPRARELAPHAGATKFSFDVADSRQVDLEPTDLLFIDTLHVYEQLQAELRRHADKARKWIILHDTTTFGDGGETKGSRGLWPAVSELLALKQFKLRQRYANNNGLTVLERV